MKKQIHKHYFKDSNLWIFVVFFAIISLGFFSCQKYLDEKPDKKLAIPSTIEDLEAMLDNYQTLNTGYPSAGEVSSDNYYLTNADWASLNDRYRNFYSWQKYDDIGGDWSAPYSGIFNANIILETLDKLKTGNTSRGEQIKGSALFIRGFRHFSLAQLFAPVYNQNTALKDLGIPIRLHSDFNIIPIRTTVSETYESILSDIKNSIRKLPAKPLLKYHPSRPAAYALLSRIYLAMGEYENAGLYADSCLQLYDSLIDYNNINSFSSAPFEQFNTEVIYDAASIAASPLIQSRAKVDTVLYSLYNTNDLRKTIFFKSNTDGSVAFKGGYSGNNSSSLFVGLATDEMYLTRAESLARKGNSVAAIADLNALLIKRWRSGTFIPYPSTDAARVLQVILEERRKELLFRTLRWPDLRRLNNEPAFAQTIYRKIDGKEYKLVPGSDRYIFQIEKSAVNISGLQQNP